MTPDRRQFLSSALLAAAAGARAAGPASKGLVTGQPQGAEAGHAVLADGGNAVDAVVAAALVAGVVAVPMTGIGGYGGHLVVARPGGKVTAIDFNSTAPAAATPDMFPADEKGAVKGNVNTHGWLAAGVPGALAERGRDDEVADERLGRPALFDEAGGEEVEQLAVDRLRALDAEIAGGGDERLAEDLSPDAVDHDAGGERVLG